MFVSKKVFLAATICLMVMGMAAMTHAEGFCDFNDNSLVSESHWGGAGSGETGFVSGDWLFPHNDGGFSWDGFVYSNESDTTTAGYGNQFSAITGGGLNGGGNYGVCGMALDWMGGTYDTIPQTISNGASAQQAAYTVEDFYVTNTTYAYLSMLNGDSAAKKFGGESGDDADWFLLTIRGIDASENYTANTVEFYLADFRFANNNEDYIIDEWTEVDLSSLGDVIGLEFFLSSSDTGTYGMNTPSYFAMDSVPEPGTLMLLGSLAVIGLLLRRKA